MSTIKKEAKLKLKEASGDLDYIAKALEITVEAADALRTYEQYHFDVDSPIIKAIGKGVADAVALVKKSGLDDEAKAIVSMAVAGLTSRMPSLLVTGQNQALIELREIPRKEIKKASVNAAVIESVNGI